MYSQKNIKFLCVLYGSHHQQQLFYCVVFATETECVYCAVWVESLNVLHVAWRIHSFNHGIPLPGLCVCKHPLYYKHKALVLTLRMFSEPQAMISFYAWPLPSSHIVTVLMARTACSCISSSQADLPFRTSRRTVKTLHVLGCSKNDIRMSYWRACEYYVVCVLLQYTIISGLSVESEWCLNSPVAKYLSNRDGRCLAGR